MFQGAATARPASRLSELRAEVAQFARRNAAIVENTPLVDMSASGSIYAGAQTAEVSDGDIVELETDVRYRSRRGPNTDFGRRQDAMRFRWFQVVGVNGRQLEKPVFIRENTFHLLPEAPRPVGAPWVIFGTNGRDERELKTAVQEGYRRFDCAESYGNTETLAKVLRAAGLERGAYEILYKFDVVHETAESLRGRLFRVITGFGGWIDSVLIHNMDGAEEDLRSAWSVLTQLKKTGLVREIGLGNIRPEHEPVINRLEGHVDVVENAVSTVVADRQVQQLIKRLNVKVLYYDVRRTADEIGLDSNEEIKALVWHMAFLNRESQMISSSGNAERQRANLASFRNNPAEEGEEEYGALARIDEWMKTAGGCPASDRAFQLAPGLRSWLDRVYTDTFAAREAIAAESRLGRVSREGLEASLRSHGAAADSLSIRFPARKGVRMRYVGMKLETILLSLLGTASCDAKWARELLGAMLASADDWDAIGCSASTNIT